MTVKASFRSGFVNGNGSLNQPAIDETRKKMETDPAFGVKGAAPNFAQYVVPHVLSFQGLFGTFSKVYRPSDEAWKDSPENARFMRNDVGIMECVEARQRATALLDWQLVPEDEESPEQDELCRQLTKIIQRIPRFTEYRNNLLHAIWFGRAGIQHRYGWQNIGGKMRVLPTPFRDNPGWLPINGDKLVFRYADGAADTKADQVGIRVGARNFKEGDKINNRWTVEATDRGLAYFLDDWERPLLGIHKHMIEDGPWEDGIDAGLIHGVGVRSRIYWEWVQKQEALSFLMEYLERSAGGIELWYYPSGNPEAEKDMRTAAENRISGGRNIMLVPKPLGDDAHAYGVDIVEPGMAGIDALKDLLTNYFGHRMKRYILGQVLSTEAEATGLGSGVAELHLDSFLQIVKYDATNLEETITRDLVKPLQHWNFPASRNIDIRFQIQTETADTEKKLQAWQAAYEMGCKLKESDVMDLIGAAMPTDGDDVLQHPQFQQMPQEGGAQGVGFGPGAGAQPPPPDPEDLGDDFLSNYYTETVGEDDNGKEISYVDENGKWEKREIPPFDTGDRARTDKLRRKYPGIENVKYKGAGWITIGGSQSGDKKHAGGTKVFLDENGNITKGPKDLKNKNIDDFKLKSEPAEKPRAPKQTQKKLPLAAPAKFGPDVVSVKDLNIDPERFQYKISATGKSGTVAGQFSDIEFNPAFAGTIHIWRDRENGKDYVVNGHHRYELAKRSGYGGKMQVYYLDAPNAEKARAYGALINIAGGNGTAVDAAKFMRDTGATPEEMREHGVSLKGQVAADASVLSGLSDRLFQQLATGTYRQGRAVAIARHIKDHDTQNKLDQRIRAAESKKGKRDLPDSVVEEMAREASLASTRTETTKDLFGETETERSTFVERAELKAAVRRDIIGQLSAFKAVSSGKRADTLTTGKQKITAEENQRKAKQLEQFLADFDRESRVRGEVSDVFAEGAERLADEPKKRKSITSEVLGRIEGILGAAISKDEQEGAGKDVSSSSGSPRSGRMPPVETFGRTGQRERFRRQMMSDFVDAYKKIKSAAGQGSLFDESKHPRDADGKFASKPGGGTDDGDTEFQLTGKPKHVKPNVEGMGGQQKSMFPGSHTDLPGQEDLFDPLEDDSPAEPADKWRKPIEPKIDNNSIVAGNISAWGLVEDLGGSPSSRSDFDDAYNAFASGYGRDPVGMLANAPSSVRSDAKYGVQKSLTYSLKKNKDFRDWLLVHHYLEEFAASTLSPVPGKDEFDWDVVEADLDASYESVAGEIANEWVGAWAGSSGDSSSESIAMQLAIEEEFGLDRWDYMHSVDDGHNPHGQKHDMACRRAEMALAKNGEMAARRAFVRSMYESTQEWFKNQGITEVALYRGMKFLDEEKTPEALREMGKNGAELNELEIEQQPASSYSLSVKTAKDFAGFQSADMSVVIGAKIPVERILSHPRTGFGCLTESEFVVLSGESKVSAVAGSGHAMYEVGHKEIRSSLETGKASPKLRADSIAAEKKRREQDDVDKYSREGLVERFNRAFAKRSKYAITTAAHQHWDEDLHPRDADGRFANKEGSSNQQLLGSKRKPQKNQWATPDKISKTSQHVKKLEDEAQKLFSYNTTGMLNLDMEEAGVLKQHVAREIAGRLEGNADFQALMAENGFDDAEAAASSYVGLWAMTSGNSTGEAIAMQRAASEEFGLDQWGNFTTSPEDQNRTSHEIWEEVKSLQAIDANSPEADAANHRHALKQADEIYAGSGAGLRAFLRAQYENTQQQLADLGIDELTLYRGMHHRERPDWVGDKKKFQGVVEIEQQPLSSWSHSAEEAKSFAVGNKNMQLNSTVIASTFKAEDILSSPLTGFGCAKEGEFVTLSSGAGTAAAYWDSSNKGMEYTLEKTLQSALAGDPNIGPYGMPLDPQPADVQKKWQDFTKDFDQESFHTIKEVMPGFLQNYGQHLPGYSDDPNNPAARHNFIRKALGNNKLYDTWLANQWGQHEWNKVKDGLEDRYDPAPGEKPPLTKHEIEIQEQNKRNAEFAAKQAEKSKAYKAESIAKLEALPADIQAEFKYYRDNYGTIPPVERTKMALAIREKMFSHGMTAADWNRITG